MPGHQLDPLELVAALSFCFNSTHVHSTEVGTFFHQMHSSHRRLGMGSVKNILLQHF